MSRNVDERIIEMRFNNSDFERNAQTTMSTIDKLKEKLNFKGVDSNLKNIEKSASSIKFTVLSDAVDTVSVKFSALQVAAVTALQNIVNKAVTSGEQLVKSLSVDQITEGYSKYEQKTAAVQTIMNATGKSIEEVSASLEKLNWFTDETSYNFVDMVDNIGKFTSAGVDLDVAVTAMQGIANEAALSGQGINEASRAMYNFAQAIGTGKVTLIDWKSIENANMATKEFKQTIIDVALAEGTLKQVGDEIVTVGKGTAVSVTDFNSALSEGWFSSDVLLKSLEKYGEYSNYIYEVVQEEGLSCAEAMEKVGDNAMELGSKAFKAAQEAKTFTDAINATKDAVSTGWMTTFELMFGNYIEAKETWTELANRLYDIFAEGGNVRNELLAEAMARPLSGLEERLDACGISIERFSTDISNAAENAGINVEDLTEQYGSLENAIYSGALDQFFPKIFQDYADNAETATVATGDLNDILDEYNDLVKRIAINGELGVGPERFKRLEEMGYDVEFVQKMVNKFVESGGEAIVTIEDLSDAELANVGYSEEQIAALRALAAEAQSTDGSFSDLVKELYRPSGRELLIDTFRNALDGLEQVIGIVKEAWAEVFPPMTAERLYDIIEKIHSLSENLILSDEKAAKLKDTFVGVFSLLDTVGKVVGFIAESIYNLIFNVADLDTVLLDITSTIGKWLTGLNDSVEKNNIFVTATEKVSTAVSKLRDIFKKFFSDVDLSTIGSGIKTVGTLFLNTFNKIISVLSKIDIEQFTNIISSLSLTGLTLMLKNFVSGLLDPLDDIKSFASNFVGIFDGVRGCLETYQTNIRADVILKIAAAVGILTVSIMALSTIDSDKITDTLGAILMLFAELIGSTAIVSKITASGVQMMMLSSVMTKVAASILILSIAMKTLSTLNWEELGKGLIGVGVLLAELTLAVRSISESNKKLAKGAANVLIFSAAIHVLAKACVTLSGLSWEELGKGLLGVSVLLAEISLFLNNTKFTGKAIETATGMVILSASLLILQAAVDKFSVMSLEGIGKGLLAIGVLLAEMGLFVNNIGKPKNIVSTGVALVAISASMLIFSNSIRSLSDLSWEGIAKGLASLAGVLLSVTVALKLMPKNVLGIGAGLILVGQSLSVISDSLIQTSTMNWEEIGKGLAAIGGSLLILAGALNLMRGTLGGSAAMVIASVALLALVPVIKTLGSLEWGEIGKGLVTIAGAFAIVGVAAALLQPLTPTILALAASFVAIGIAIVGLGAGLTLIGAGLSSVAIGLTTLGVSIATVVVSLVSAVPTIIEVIKEVVIGILQLIYEAAPEITKAIIAIMNMVLDVVVDLVPRIVEVVLVLIDNVLKSLVNYLPGIVDSILDLLVAIVNTVAENLEPLIESVVNLFISLFKGIFDAFVNEDPEIFLEMLAGIGIIAAVLVALNAAAGLVPGAMAGAVGVAAVITEIGILLAAMGALAQIPGLTWLIEEGGAFAQAIGTAIGGFIGGILGGIMSGITDGFPQIGANLSEFMSNVKPFIDGVKDVDESCLIGIQALSEAILTLTKAEILNGLTSWFSGGISLVDFGKELAEFGPSLKEYANSLSGLESSVIVDSANAAKAIAEMATNLPNSKGVVSWFTGDNTLSDFAEELKEFGPSLKSYSDSVVGLDSSVVMDSANAAKAIAEMATNLPNSKGVVSWFTGDNTLSDFSKELDAFGPSLKSYSDSLIGLDGSVVVDSANAAKAIAEMATNLPNSKGVVSWFTGDNTLSDFAKELDTFGPSLKSYSDSLKGLNGSVVVDSANAAKAIAEMATNLPNSGGVVSWFSGDNTLSDFAKDLEKFGPSLKSYSDGLQGLDGDAIVDSSIAAKTLAETKMNVSSATGDLVSFGTEIESFGKSLKFYSDSVSGIPTDLVTKYEQMGLNVVQGFVDGIDKNLDKVKDAAASIGETAMTETRRVLDIHSPSGKFYEMGVFSTEGYSEGVEAGQNSVIETIKGFGDNVLDSFDLSKVSEAFTEAGFDLSDILGSEFQSVFSKNTFSMDSYTNQLSGMNDQLETMTANLRTMENTRDSLIATYGEESKEVKEQQKVITNYQKKITEQQKKIKEFTSSNKSMVNFVQNEKLNEAKKKYDELLDDFANGRIKQAEYDKKYVELLKEYSNQAIDVMSYSNKKINDLIQVSLDNIKSKYESKLTEIQSKMKSLQDSVQKTYNDAITYTTNKDIYDKKVSDYEKEIKKLNKQLQTTEKQYGSNSKQAQNYRKQLNELNKEYEAYKTYYDEEEFDDDEIVNIAFNDEFTKSTDEINNYIKSIKDLQSRNIVSQDLIDYIGTLDAKKGKQTVDWLNSLSDEELRVAQEALDANKAASKELSELLFKPEIEEATNEYVTNFTNVIGALPDTAKGIGIDIVRGLTNGFTEETENSLEIIGSSGDKIIEELKNRLGIHSPSKVAEEEIGVNLADGLKNGFVDRLSVGAKQISDLLTKMVTGSFSSLSLDESDDIVNQFNTIIAALDETINSDLETEPTIRPVLDLSNVYTGIEELNSLLSYNNAVAIGNSIDFARKIQNSSNIDSDAIRRPTTVNNFTQNNYSPDALDRRSIRRDTEAILQLHNYVH